MKEQPQRPIPLKTPVAPMSIKGEIEWIWMYQSEPTRKYMDHLESQLAAKDKRIAELERQLALITEWCKLSVEHMKPYAGDQSEYDGMYQASADLLERINGTMPWPDLVMERLSKVK